MMIDRVVGNNRIVEQVGEGGMGAVYRAVDLMLDREVAIKAIRPELTRDTEIVERFRAEARMLARVNHPAIATIYSFFVDGDELFLAMEFVRGETLAHLLLTGGPMPWERAVPLLATALEGIEQAHQAGIVHRDLKPENLMITEAGAVKVMDFGIARVVGSGRLTRTGLLIGTLRYMAPEQIRGEEADRRTDVYALGIVLYEMLTGAVPFDGASDYAVLKAQVEEQPRPPSAKIPALPAWLDQTILRALEKDPARRFQTVEDLRRHLLGRGQPLTTAAVMPVGVGVAAGGGVAGAAAGVAGAGVAVGAAGDAAAGAAGAAGPLGAAGMKRVAGDAPDPDGTVLRPGPPGLAGGPAAAGGPASPAAGRAAASGAPGPGAGPAGHTTAGGLGGGAASQGSVPASGRAGASAAPAGAAAVPGGGGSYREMPPWRPAAAGQGKGRSKALLAAALALIAIVAFAVVYRLRMPAPGGTAAGSPGGAAARPTVGGLATAGAAGSAGNRDGRVAGDRDSNGAPGNTVGNTVAGQPAGGADRSANGDGGPGAGGRVAGATPGATTVGGEQAGGAGTGSSGAAGANETPPATEREGAAGGGGEAGAQGTPAQAGEKAGAGVVADLRQLGAALVVESGEIRILYTQYLSRQERRRAQETSAGEQLDSALQEFRRAVERFDGQFQGGFFARSRLRLGRLTHGEDERAQMQRLARTLVESGAHVEALMPQARPATAVRQLWHHIHSQVQRLAQECGI